MAHINTVLADAHHALDMLANTGGGLIFWLPPQGQPVDMPAPFGLDGSDDDQPSRKARTRPRDLAPRGSKSWTSREINLLLRLRNDEKKQWADIADVLGRSSRSVVQKGERLRAMGVTVR